MSDSVSKTGMWAPRPVYTRVTVVGLLIYAAIFLFVGILAAIGGDVGALVFLGLFAILSLVLAGLAWRFGRWLLILAAVWALLSLVFHGTFMVPALFSYFNSFFDGGLAVPALAGIILALVGGITSFVQHRHGAARTTAKANERRVFAGITVVVVGLMILSGVLHIVGLESVSAEDKAGALVVDMKNTKFKPDQLEATVGETIRIIVKNRDFAVHTFTLDEMGVDFALLGRGEQLIEITPSTPGTYEYSYEVKGHEDMKGTLVVK